MDRENWLEERKKYIGASDAPIIMGVSPWKTLYQLWENKLGLDKEEPTNFAQQRGIDMEEEARNAYSMITGNIVEPKQVFHPTIRYMMANLDGINDEQTIAVEIKCPGLPDHQIAQNNMVPEKYYPQLQHQLAVAGLDMIHYCSYRDGECVIIEVPKDDGYIKKMYLAERKFWECVESLTPPPLTDKDYFQRSDIEWMKASSQWQELNDQLEDIKEKEKSAREILIALADGKSSVGAGIKLQRILRKGSVDYGAIPQLKDIDLESYRKSPVESWRPQKLRE